MSTGKMALLCFSMIVLVSLVLGIAVQDHLDFLQAPCYLLLAAGVVGLLGSFVKWMEL